MTINEKLATIQTKFKSKKSRFNSFGKYYFRSAEDILEATKPFLLELGVTVTINEEVSAFDNLSLQLAMAKMLYAQKLSSVLILIRKVCKYLNSSVLLRATVRNML